MKRRLIASQTQVCRGPVIAVMGISQACLPLIFDQAIVEQFRVEMRER
jgi:hypothetical protein